MKSYTLCLVLLLTVLCFSELVSADYREPLPRHPLAGGAEEEARACKSMGDACSSDSECCSDNCEAGTHNSGSTCRS